MPEGRAVDAGPVSTALAKRRSVEEIVTGARHSSSRSSGRLCDWLFLSVACVSGIGIV